VSKQNTRRVLFFTDIHGPYHHIDMFDFLDAVKQKYRPTYVVCGGDEGDNHALSLHDSDPDLDSAGAELRKLQAVMSDLAMMFPRLDICESNHGSLVYRRAKKNGIPAHYIKPYIDILFPVNPPEWIWAENFRAVLPNGHTVEFIHQTAGHLLNAAAHKRCCLVTGHQHARFEIVYGASTAALYWQMIGGSLVDNSALAFAYGKQFPKKPIVGCSLILNSIPVLQPMLLNSEGRWVGKL